uniref:Uncharacterized protein n=1 Tax=Arundo donax TaxID=35708 RepID=A0A0A9A2V9_ARUDO
MFMALTLISLSHNLNSFITRQRSTSEMYQLPTTHKAILRYFIPNE